jgi:hypothetical protein
LGTTRDVYSNPETFLFFNKENEKEETFPIKAIVVIPFAESRKEKKGYSLVGYFSYFAC